MDPMNPTQERSSGTTWLVVAVIVVLAALGIWYYSTQSTSSSTDSNTATSLSDEFNQVPDNGAALDQDAAASASVVGSF